MTVKILGGQSIPNLPWQDKPANEQGVVWRYTNNPVIDWNPFKALFTA